MFKLPRRNINGPDGQPYLVRYFLFKIFGITCYLHHFVNSDPGQNVHDHPWGWAFSIILKGEYIEERMNGFNSAGMINSIWRTCRWFNMIRGTDFHRVILHKGPVWTLFIHGKRTKGWGFLKEAEYQAYALNEFDYPQADWWKGV